MWPPLFLEGALRLVCCCRSGLARRAIPPSALYSPCHHDPHPSNPRRTLWEQPWAQGQCGFHAAPCNGPLPQGRTPTTSILLHRPIAGLQEGGRVLTCRRWGRGRHPHPPPCPGHHQTWPEPIFVLVTSAHQHTIDRQGLGRAAPNNRVRPAPSSPAPEPYTSSSQLLHCWPMLSITAKLTPHSKHTHHPLIDQADLGAGRREHHLSCARPTVLPSSPGCRYLCCPSTCAPICRE